MLPEAERRGTLKVEGKQNSLSPVGTVISVLLYHRTERKRSFSFIIHEF